MKSENKSYKIWVVSTVSIIAGIFFIIAAITIYVDPFFHYHAPVDELEYLIKNQRYQNDGIVRNFEYDGIVTGSSMTENFKTSEADRIFNAKFVKVSFSGASYREINDNLKRAYGSSNNIKYVIRALDKTKLILDKDFLDSQIDDSFYIRNDNVFDDINYVLNKEVLLNNVWGGVINYTINGNKTTSFDAYSNWNSDFEFGADSVLKSYTLNSKIKEEQVLSNQRAQMVIDNIIQNVTDLADEYPETTFYYFFPPYSICYWDIANNNGQINLLIDAEKLVIWIIIKIQIIMVSGSIHGYLKKCIMKNIY